MLYTDPIRPGGTVRSPNTAVLWTGEKQGVFRNNGIGRGGIGRDDCIRSLNSEHRPLLVAVVVYIYSIHCVRTSLRIIYLCLCTAQSL